MRGTKPYLTFPLKQLPSASHFILCFSDTHLLKADSDGVVTTIPSTNTTIAIQTKNITFFNNQKTLSLRLTFHISPPLLEDSISR